MGVTLHVSFKNQEQVKRALASAPAVMAKNLNYAIKVATLLVGRQSRIFTPVDTGRLRASTRERFYNLKGEVSTNVAYDIFVHEGTRYMKPRPFLRNAIDRTEPEISRLFNKAVQDTLDDIGRG